MNFSLDTNIILGIVNTRDRLHEVSIALMRDKRKEPLILCNSAIKESHNVLRNKINEIMVEIIGFFRDIYQNPNIGSIDSQALIIEKFKKIDEIHPDFDIIYLDLNHLSNVKKSLADIHFKDTNDERIFQELMTNIGNDLGFEKEAFSCRLLNDHNPNS